MSYDHVSLYKTVLARLIEDPAVTLGDLAQTLNVSRRTVQEIVIALSGGPFRLLQDRLLVAKVCTLLQEHPMWSIKELAFSAGYKSPRSFARALKRACGAAPREVRARIGSFGRAQAVDLKSQDVGALMQSQSSCSGSDSSHDELELSITLSRSHIDLLNLYREFTGDRQKDIVTLALMRMFQSEGEFWSWLVQRKTADLCGMEDRTPSKAAS